MPECPYHGVELRRTSQNGIPCWACRGGEGTAGHLIKKPDRLEPDPRWSIYRDGVC